MADTKLTSLPAVTASALLAADVLYLAAGGTPASSKIAAAELLGDGTNILCTYDAADVRAQRRGTTAQKYRVYNTTDGAGNSEYAELGWSANVLTLQATKAGTGTLRSLVLGAGSGTLTMSTGGNFTLAPPVATTGSPTLLTLTGPAHTTLTASTEAADINWNLARTVQFATGALTLQRAMRVQAPTYAFAGASTLTTAVTLDIGGAPVAGTNATLTNTVALQVNAGHAAGIPVLIQLAGGQTALALDVRSSGGTSLASISAAGAGTLASLSLGTALPVASGGTGQTSAANAFNALTPTQTGNSGKYLTTDGSVASWATVAGGGSPGGSNGQVQYNSSSSFAGAAAMVYATSSAHLTVTSQAATDKAIIAKGATSQSVAIFEVQDSTATAVHQVVASGRTGIGTTASATSSVWINFPSGNIYCDASECNLRHNSCVAFCNVGVTVYPVMIYTGSAPTRRLYVLTQAAGTVGMEMLLNSGQTADAIQVKNSGGSAVFVVDAGGFVYGKRPVVTVSGTTRTFALTDANTLQDCSNASAQTLTVPPNSSVAFPVGTEIDILQSGAGQVDVAAGAGVTINSKASNLKLSAQYSTASLKKMATDTWVLSGDLSA